MIKLMLTTFLTSTITASVVFATQYNSSNDPHGPTPGTPTTTGPSNVPNSSGNCTAGWTSYLTATAFTWWCTKNCSDCTQVEGTNGVTTWQPPSDVAEGTTCDCSAGAKYNDGGCVSTTTSLAGSFCYTITASSQLNTDGTVNMGVAKNSIAGALSGVSGSVTVDTSLKISGSVGSTVSIPFSSSSTAYTPAAPPATVACN